MCALAKSGLKATSKKAKKVPASLASSSLTGAKKPGGAKKNGGLTKAISRDAAATRATGQVSVKSIPESNVKNESGSLAVTLLGKKAPAFKVEGTSALSVDSSKLLGTPWVLYFYPKDHTPGCTLEGQDFKKLHAKFETFGCSIFGVSKDSLKRHASFREKFGFPFELIADEDEMLCRKFDVIQMKKLYGREYEGIERSTFLVDAKGVVRGEWRRVKVAGHADAVLGALKSLES